ncbi:MAG: choice-of-anchor Q domain-containing protein [Acidobacteriota bacterium]
MRRLFLVATTVCLTWSADTAPAAEFNIADGDVAGLVAAVNTANANNQPDVIHLAAGGTYTLTVIQETNDGGNGLPVIMLDTSTANTLTIEGHGATLMRSADGGTPSFRILKQGNGALILNDLTVAGGFTPHEGGIFHLSSGITSIQRCTLTGSHSDNKGEALYIGNSCNVTLVNCTLSGNSSAKTSDLSNSAGGGCINTRGTLTLRHCTVANNLHTGPAASGGGIRVWGTLTLVNTVLGNNSDQSGPNDLERVSGTVNSTNSLIEALAAGTINGTDVGNITGLDTVLGPLADNGGLTMTHALLPSSPAIDAASAADCESQDQRGLPRPSGLGCDIGAYELIQEPDLVPDLQSTVKLDSNLKSFVARFKVLNDGFTPAGPFTVGLYLSADATFGRRDRLLKKLSVGAIGPSGASKLLRVKYQGSRSILGKYVIIAVDTTNAVDEGSEDNNVLVKLLSK